MRISIFGLGYVGAVSLACLARDGHAVIGVDIDHGKLDLINRGQSPIIEEGIQELVAQSVSSGRVETTDDAVYAIRNSELSFVCVGTPSRPNGSQDQTAIKHVVAQIGKALASADGYHVVVIRSTVMPGTVETLIAPTLERESGKRIGSDFGLCFQPEFLREGSSIRDYDNPPLTVVGSDSERTAEPLRAVFGCLPCEFVTTDIGTAEILKYACNAFHAMKVTFANEIGRVAAANCVDSREVMKLVCMDHSLNISPAYLRPGFAFGGSCLPKDLRALMYSARMEDVELPMLGSILASNQTHIGHGLRMVLDEGRRRVGMIGLSFKSGTDDLRESPLVVMAETFIGKGLDLRIYDPEVSLSRLVGANKRYIEESIPHIASLMCDSVEELIAHAQTLVVGLSDDALLQAVYEGSRANQLVIDLVNFPEPERIKGRYRGICW